MIESQLQSIVTASKPNKIFAANIMENCKIDKTAFSIGSLHDGGDEKQYWLSKTPQERIEALDMMRQIVYAYDSSVERIQKYFEIADLKKS